MTIHFSALDIAFLLPAVFTVLVIGSWARRQRRNGERVSIIALIYGALVIGTLSMLFAGVVGMMAPTLGGYFSPHKHAAVVVAHVRHGDTVGMVVAFTDTEGVAQRKRLGFSSSKPIPIGTRITVKWAPGDATAVNLSVQKLGLMLLLPLIFFFLLGYFVLWAGLAALGLPYGWLLELGAGAIVYLLIPAAMLFFIAAFSWVMWDFLMDEDSDTPIWVLVFCSLGVTVLVPVLFQYLKMQLFGQKRASAR